MKRFLLAALMGISVLGAQETDDLTSYQGYLWGDSTFMGMPSRGVNVQEAWDLGYRGQGVHIADVQMDWDLDHEDLRHKSISRHSWTPPGIVIPGAKQHGTNSLGILFAENNGIGMTGIATEAEGSAWDMLHEVLGGTVGATIDSAAANLKAGDILQLEISTAIDNNHNVGPAEVNRGNWEAIKRAVDKGIIVIQAAGNGGENLDHPDYEEYRSWGDNGSIIVGAGSISQERLPISTYGERVNVQAWGDTVVATPGTYQWDGVTSQEWHHGVTYDNDESRAYSFQFSGTSSALPMVVGVAAIFQSWAIDSLGYMLNSREMRDLLIASGHAQDTSRDSRHIGPIPDVKRGLEILRTMLPTGINDPGSVKRSAVKLAGSIVSVQEKTEFSVVDMRGRILFTQILTGGSSLDISKLAFSKGCYLLKVKSSKQVESLRYIHQ